MNYTIRSDQKESAYMQLYRLLRRDIEEGVFAFAARLPSKRLLAEETGVSVITVEHAYAILCEEGYAEARPRSGYYVIYRDADFPGRAAPAEAPAAPPPAPHTESGFPFSVLARTMRKVLLDEGERILIKSPNRGCAALRAALAAYLARSNGMRVRPEQIVIGAGAEYLYGLIVQLLGKERVFGLEEPGYDQIRKVYAANGVACDLLELGAGGILPRELARTAATVLHVTPFNSYPSGVTADASKRREYIRWAQRRGGYIIEDNFESELTVSRKNEDTVFSLWPQGAVIYLNTFSKTVAPAVRAGYMILPPALLAEFERKLGFYSCTVPVFEQYVLAELLNSGDFERHINRVRRTRRKQAEGPLQTE